MDPNFVSEYFLEQNDETRQLGSVSRLFLLNYEFQATGTIICLITSK